VSYLSLVLILESTFLVDLVENEVSVSVSKATVRMFNLALQQHVWEGGGVLPFFLHCWHQRKMSLQWSVTAAVIVPGIHCIGCWMDCRTGK
jgi:hypothetical protein